MTTGNKCIDQKITWASFFGKTLSLDTEAGCMDILSGLYNDLSPENLTCDGELRGSAVVAKQKQLVAAIKFVEKKLGRSVSEDQAFAYIKANK